MHASASLTRTVDIPGLLKSAADPAAVSAEARISPAPLTHFNTRTATQASTQGCNTIALDTSSNEKQAERKAVSLREVRGTVLEKASCFPVVAPVTLELCDFSGQ